MKVVLHDRTNGLGQEVRETAHRKLTRLARHFGRVVDAEVEFSEWTQTRTLRAPSYKGLRDDLDAVQVGWDPGA